MAERGGGKARKQGRKPPPTPARGAGTPAPSVDEEARLRAECVRLQRELAEAKARLTALETERRQLADRIEWAIDSLHTLRESDE